MTLEMFLWHRKTRRHQRSRPSSALQCVCNVQRTLYADENCKLNTLKYEELRDWIEVTNCQRKTGMLLPMFCEVPLKVKEVMGVTPP